jgi:hypothetical protein
MNMIPDVSLLEAALIGYRVSLEKIDQKIAEIRRELSGTPTEAAVSVTTDEPKQKRRMSAAGKKAVRAALKKRWAEFHAKIGKAPKKTTRKKRVLSPAAKKHIADATKKRWAEYRAQKAAAA